MCKAGSWKREVVPDHKFDFVDTREFTDNGFGMRMKYLWLYIIVLKSFLVYISDIFTAITMATTHNWSNQVFANCSNTANTGCVFIPFTVGKWIFIGCIIVSFLLLAYEGHKSKKIIASRDISYAFTNVMANHYYSLRSYNHFCFFSHISNSTKKKDDFAFFIFFTFKSWKRLLLADAPRQTINALTLYAIYLAKHDKGPWDDFTKYFAGNTFVTTVLTFSMLFTVLICAGSMLMLIIAGVCYVPWLCYIQGNLKEYVCHKVDKRIAEIIRRRNKQRLQKAQALAKKEAMGDFSHLKNKKGELVHQPLPQPTLPNVSLDDDEFDDGASQKTRGPAPSTYTQDTYYYNADHKAAYPPKDYATTDYPPMPAYAGQPYGQQYQSTQSFGDDRTLYGDDRGASKTQLDGPDQYHYGAGQQPDYGQQDYVHDPQAYPHDYPNAHSQYSTTGYAAYPEGHAHTGSMDDRLPTPNLAYDQDYPSPTSGGPPPRSFAGQMGDVGNMTSGGNGQGYGRAM
ncbi:hypothetical protein PUNSTDRAFT_100476 [Punctularia strigosozonata HHB-11173 SS5]|uniref:uncharacterized protein n=1 Tax=Punctularia strigosozonata (strain HHB-11173) TaxID=741275 RepID=UPI0004416797|nr:uncharacterized protein PUNSTDRAFT_100476 [Punctularia strigosozonata HHB-11173 SS5]EIN10735.1 hypothetical protein PUNSTDRAFT_100476 [Punctularia strigosozonata HHB-11173 SS5]